MHPPPVALTDARFGLAEGPVWDAGRSRVVWVDIPAGAVVVARLGDDGLEVEAEHRVDTTVGAVLVAADGSLLVAGARSLVELSADGTPTARLSLASYVGAGERLNDATCDARGRVLVGTLSLTGHHHGQRLLQVVADVEDGVRVLDDDLGLSNGLAFSPDGGTLYSVDSEPGTIWRRDYDQATGLTGPRGRLLDLGADTPDGVVVDAEGCLWVAIWGAGEVRRHSPTGDLLDVRRVPAPHTTCAGFVGERLERMVVTTAREGLDDARLEQWPLSGALFELDPGCTGLAPYPWTGTLPRGTA